ncbi:MAG: carbon storage regulator CsrA [Nanoarchaeota archaeon]|nr:carbon storage regulator CsrA [Nanoarchaeota archaeon]
MLVLSRQKDESIVIGDDIEITVVDIRGDKVRLGITAPSEIPVHRKEVYEDIVRENVQAAKVKPENVADVDKAIARSRKPQRGGNYHMQDNPRVYAEMSGVHVVRASRGFDYSVPVI